MKLRHKKELFLILFQFSPLVFSSVETDCYGRNRVCNSLSASNPNSWKNDFLQFKQICLDDNTKIVKDLYPAAFTEAYLGVTETIYSLYSLCHDSYPECRQQGSSCFCNVAMKDYFESTAYLAFSKCRKTTQLGKRKGQGKLFFQISVNNTMIKDFNDVCKYKKNESLYRGSKWFKQYWNGIGSQAAKDEIYKYCRNSAKALGTPRGRKGQGNTSDFSCKRVGEVLKQFQFIGQLNNQKDSKTALFGVGMISYCGACECCEMNNGGSVESSTGSSSFVLPPIDDKLSFSIDEATTTSTTTSSKIEDDYESTSCGGEDGVFYC